MTWRQHGNNGQRWVPLSEAWLFSVQMLNEDMMSGILIQVRDREMVGVHVIDEAEIGRASWIFPHGQG